MSTFALSVAGFVLAIIGNVWSFGLTFVRWPRVSVETRSHLYLVPGGPNEDKIELTVINRGSEAVTISNIGLRPVDPSHMPRDYVRDEADYPDRLPKSHHDPLPLRVEGRGVLRWIYGPHQLELRDEALTERTRGAAKRAHPLIAACFSPAVLGLPGERIVEVVGRRERPQPALRDRGRASSRP